MLVVIGLIAVLATLSSISLIRPQAQATLNISFPLIAADIRGQQIQAMLGSTSGEATAQSYGIYLGTDSYTLFKGTSYNPVDISNFVINLEQGLTITNITLPSSEIVFNRRSGEVSGYSAGSDSFTIRNTVSNEEKVITINRYGVLDIN